MKRHHGTLTHSPTGRWVVEKQAAVIVARDGIEAAGARHAVATAHTTTIDFCLAAAISEAVDRN